MISNLVPNILRLSLLDTVSSSGGANRLLTFPCSVRDAASALKVHRNTLGILVVVHKIPTMSPPLNPRTKQLDREGYRRAARAVRRYRRLLLVAAQ